MQIIEEVLTEATNAIAHHYAEKIKAQRGDMPTQEELGRLFASNWTKISEEIALLYRESIKALEQA